MVDDRVKLGEHVAQGRFEDRPQLGQELLDGAADMLVDRTAADGRQILVHVHEPEVRVAEPEGDWCVLEQGVEPGHSLGELSVGPLRLSVVGLARARGGARAPRRRSLPR